MCGNGVHAKPGRVGASGYIARWRRTLEGGFWHRALGHKIMGKLSETRADYFMNKTFSWLVATS